MLGPGSTPGPCVQSTGMDGSAHLPGEGTGLAHLDVTDKAYKQTRVRECLGTQTQPCLPERSRGHRARP